MYISAGNLTDYPKVTPQPNDWGVGTMGRALYTPLEWGLPLCDLRSDVILGAVLWSLVESWKQNWKEDWQGTQT